MLSDVAPARWLQESLCDEWTVAYVVPPVFPAYALISHPLADPDDPGSAPGFEIPLDVLTPFVRLFNDANASEVYLGVWEGSGIDPGSSSVFGWAPETEGMSRRQQRSYWKKRTLEHREQIRFSFDPAVYEAMARRTLIGLPGESQGRDHLILRAPLRALATPTWPEGAGLGYRAADDRGRMPNVVWPQSREWVIACDMDSSVTAVGGSQELIDAVIESPDLHAVRVGPHHPLPAWDE